MVLNETSTGNMAMEPQITPEGTGTGEDGPWYTSVVFIASSTLFLILLILILLFRKMIVILYKTFPRDVK
jgi:hypothetical protein